MLPHYNNRIPIVPRRKVRTSISITVDPRNKQNFAKSSFFESLNNNLMDMRPTIKVIPIQIIIIFIGITKIASENPPVRISTDKAPKTAGTLIKKLPCTASFFSILRVNKNANVMPDRLIPGSMAIP